jgi:hypothetical protein
MVANVKFWGILVAMSCVVFGQMTDRSSAVTAEVAKKCNALAAKAFPPRQVGNPAAGVIGGGKARQEYYRKCIENGGNMDHNAKEAK